MTFDDPTMPRSLGLHHIRGQKEQESVWLFATKYTLLRELATSLRRLYTFI